MSKSKKKFSETTFGKILSKAGDIIPDASGIILKATIGGNPMGAVSDAISALKKNNTPKSKELLTELNIKLAEIELEFSKVQLEETIAYLGDVKDARSREVNLAKEGKKNYFQIIVGSLGLIMLGFCLYVLVYKSIPLENRTLFIHFIGIIEGISVSIFGYYFGSSQGSKEKTTLLGK